MNGTDTTDRTARRRSARDRGRAVRPRDGPQPAARIQGHARPGAGRRAGRGQPQRRRGARQARGRRRRVAHAGRVLVGLRRRADRPGPAAHPAADRPARAPQLPQAARPALRAPSASRAARGPHPRARPATSSTRWSTTARCNFHDAFAEPLPTTVFLQLLGLPARPGQGVHRAEGRHRPPAGAARPRSGMAMVNETGQQIYAVLQEVIDAAPRRARGRLHLAVPRLRGRRPPPHPRGRHRHRLPVLPGRPRHRDGIARLHARLPRPAPRAAAAARRRPVAHPPRGRGDAAVGDAGARA